MSRIISICTPWKQFYVLSIALLSFCFSIAQNPIVIENSLPGNPSSEWDVAGAGDLSIQGFSTDISVNKGQTVHFKIKTDAVAYTIDIYRLGYYGGMGARLVGNGTITATLPQIQPSPVTDAITGLVDCGNWHESAIWNVPTTAVSGIYIATLKRTDNGGASHIAFIVRNDASHSDLFFKTSDATWQAYNIYGGNSLYVGTTLLPGGHASKVSYNRPFLSRDGGGGGGPGQDWLFDAEYPMIRFLERNGYDLSYTTDIDVSRSGSFILNHKVFLSVGHDEYWSAQERANVTTARNAGIHLAFFSGNEVYWKTRWENSVDGSNTPYRTLVCYKEGTLGENACGEKCDPSPEWTGLWRDGCDSPASGGCSPENVLTGQISWQNTTAAIEVPGIYKNFRFWRNTSIALLDTGNKAIFPDGTLGHEWSFEQYADSYPSGRITLSSTTVAGYTHKLSLYRHSSGAFVFGAGTIQWAWGLDDTHDRGGSPASQDMQQATVNLFAEMGVQPSTLQPGLIATPKSTETQAAVTVITYPANGGSVPAFKPVIITGTASDANAVGSVEVSVDGGITWKTATGTTNWSFSWTPTAEGSFTIKTRGYDDLGNMETPGSVPSSNAISGTVTPPQCPCIIFNPADVPATTNIFDNLGSIEIGVKFRSSTPGYITGLRFYKSTNDTGTHIGSLWTLSGTLIARKTFTNESASGWQEILLDTPVAIIANTTYVASYNSPTGYYAETNPYFDNAFTNGPLTAIASTGTDGPNGVYKYSSTPTFPTLSFQSDNYWMDVVYNTSVTDTIPPHIVSTLPTDNANGVNINTSIVVNFDESVDPSSVNNSTIELRDIDNSIIPVTISYDPGLYKVVLTPESPLSYSSLYKVTISGGTSGIKDKAGNPLESDVTGPFTTLAPPPIPPAEGPDGPILVISTATNPFSRFTTEILKAEGLNEYKALDITQVSAPVLNSYDVVVLGEMTITPSQVSMLTDWVNAGGTLIAFKPDSLLTPLLGISAPAGALSNKYLLVNNAGPGTGIVNQTIQFHGTANLHTLAGATSLATLYSTASASTVNPAVTTINVGTNGGKAIAFTYDLARSIVYTRQGNPAWAGQKRDDQAGPIRSDDLFFGGTDADWIDFNKIAIPQADEQQRLLANIIIQSNLHRKPLPRFWYLPKELKAAIIMTGDDHGFNGTEGRFNQYLSLGPNTPQDVANWTAIRATSYMYGNTPISDGQAAAFEAQGFELAVHPATGCNNFTVASLENDFSTQLPGFASSFPSLSAPVTNRTHCMPWSDWASHAKVEVNHGIRLDVNYYYWPDVWVQNRPGMFTGSGLPMRFADIDGTLIDCYQAPTQMTDESGIGIANFCDQLLDKALGPEGYYGTFVANMHTDTADHTGSDAIIASALARQVPVISAKQMLTWLDGRNNSSFGSMVWNGNVLNFTITAATGAVNLKAMLPLNSGTDELVSITRGSTPVNFSTQTIKGMQYAFFDAATSGNYTATYGATAATLTGTVVLQGRPAAPDVQWQVPVQVQLYTAGEPEPVYTYNVTTDQNGQFTINDIPAGTYNIGIKNSHSMRNGIMGKVLVAGSNHINFGMLLEGDVDNDNYVTLADISILVNSFNRTVGDPGVEANADLDNDGYITLADISLLVSNFNQGGWFNP